MFANQFKTFFLLAALGSILVCIGYAFGGMFGGIYALVMALIINATTYFYADRMVLRLYNATPLPDEKEYAHIRDTVAELCKEINMPVPRLYLVPSSLPNAFATGRSPSHAVVALSTGIIQLLEPHELRGVLAHELAHVHNRDTLIGTIAATLATSIGSLADMIRWSLFWGARGKSNENRGSGAGLFFIAMLTPLIAFILQLSISRSREYLADELGARISHDPLGLASALRKLQSELVDTAQQPPSTAHATAASLFIVYPFRSSGLHTLFSTHPPIHKRIERLERMAQS